MSASLIQKYDVPGSRYTSYPTVPYWDDVQFSQQSWEQLKPVKFVQSRWKKW